jgi:hypothetical protein
MRVDESKAEGATRSAEGEGEPATRSAEGATRSAEGEGEPATRSAEGATRAAEGATRAAEGATRAAEGEPATPASEGSTAEAGATMGEGSPSVDAVAGRDRTRIVAPEAWLPPQHRDSAPVLHHAEPTHPDRRESTSPPAADAGLDGKGGTLVVNAEQLLGGTRTAVSPGADFASEGAEGKVEPAAARAGDGNVPARQGIGGVFERWISALPNSKVLISTSKRRFLELPLSRRISLGLLPLALFAFLSMFWGGASSTPKEPSVRIPAKPADSGLERVVVPTENRSDPGVAPSSLLDAPKAPGTSEKTLERQGADAIAEGNYAAARRIYQTLAAKDPDNEAYRAVLKLLDRRLKQSK